MMGGGMGYGGGGGRGRGRGGRGRGMGRGMGTLQGTPGSKPENPEHEVEMLRAQTGAIMAQFQAVNARISETQDTEASTRGGDAEIEKRAAVVDQERCTGCGICIEACPEEAITVEYVAMIDPQKCTVCGSCVDECPNEAISLPN